MRRYFQAHVQEALRILKELLGRGVSSDRGDAAARLPKLVVCLRGYTAAMFASDLVAGVTVGLVALPLAMAFAIASGLHPQSGIYCAIVAGFLISALAGLGPRSVVQQGHSWWSWPGSWPSTGSTAS